MRSDKNIISIIDSIKESTQGYREVKPVYTIPRFYKRFIQPNGDIKVGGMIIVKGTYEFISNI